MSLPAPEGIVGAFLELASSTNKKHGGIIRK
jgi:hypothetical protein